MNKIKAIIFDMDGVLIEAKDWHYEALNRALSLFGCPISRYDHLVTYDGLPTMKKLEMLTLERGLPNDLHSFINELKQIYTMEIVHTNCKPIFQHEYALSNLSAMNYKLGLASNAVRNSVHTMLEKANIHKYFDLILSNQDVTRAKPDPEIYTTAIKSFDLKPQQCLVIEDNEKGIKAAQEAKAHLMVVNSVYDVTLTNIISNIDRIESEVE
jgi:HAD superfamily hydrolase (TIGR01509 family)